MLHNYLKLDLTEKYKFNITFKFMYVKSWLKNHKFKHFPRNISEIKVYQPDFSKL